MKTCTKCGVEKPLTEFYRSAGTRDGLRPDCKVCKRASVAAKQSENPDKHRANAAKWYAANRERAKANSAAYRLANPECPEKMRKRSTTWHAANPGKVKAKVAHRRAAKLQATPAWADKPAINAFYAACPAGHHVDHEVPLKGKTVCGLHVLHNLQYLPALENLKKSNKLAYE